MSGDAAALALQEADMSIVFECLLSFLPPATSEHGKVTATSVIMPVPPRHRVSYKLAGNIVKCFIVVLNDSSSQLARKLYESGLIDRLVSLLANTKEIVVRKNVAIVLAKASRDSQAKERIRELRGIEMLMQLGPQ